MKISINNITKIIVSYMIFNVILFGATFSYEKYPQTIYDKQIFAVTIKSYTPINSYIDFVFDIDGNIQPISDRPIVSTIDNISHYKFFFKNNQDSVSTPKISILYDGIIETLNGLNINVRKLSYGSEFSGIIATNLIVKTYQVSKYNKDKNIIMLSLETIDGNARDMHLDLAVQEESENIVQNYDKQSCSYYAIIDSSVKNIYFTYYNTAQRKFIKVLIPTIVKDSTVAAQSNLNPDFDNFEKLKKIFYGIMFIISIIVFIRRRKIIYIIIGLLFLGFLLMSNIPRELITIKKGSEIYILPVSISKIDEKIDSNLSTAKLGEQNGFIKIVYKPNKIGWIRNENILKD